MKHILTLFAVAFSLAEAIANPISPSSIVAGRPVKPSKKQASISIPKVAPNLRTTTCFRWSIWICHPDFGGCTHITSDWSCWTSESARTPYIKGEVVGSETPVTETYVDKVHQEVTIVFANAGHDGEDYILDEVASLHPQNGYPEGCAVTKAVVRAGSYKITGDRVVIPAVIE